MTPSERERRIEAAAECLGHAPNGLLSRDDITAMLDAADEAVPVVSEQDAGREIAELAKKWSDRCERAEAAARDLYATLEDFLDGKHENDGAYQRLRDVLSRTIVSPSEREVEC